MIGMRLMSLILAALLLLQLQRAEIPYSIAYQSQFIVPEGKSYSTANFTYNNTTAYVLLVGTVPYAAFLSSQTPGKFVPESDGQALLPILESYYRSQGFSPESAAGLDSVHESIMEIKDRRKLGEEKCRVLTGTDRSLCTDFFSCQKACYSVTSFCLPIALGSGRFFIETISEFENATLALDGAYENESAAYGEWKNNSTAISMWNYLHSIEQLNKAATRASSSYLYSWYSYCFSPDYSLAELTSAQLAAQRDYLSASPFLSLSDYAAVASTFSAQGMQRRLASELEFNRSLAANLSMLKNSSANRSNATGQAAPAAASLQQPGAEGAPAILILALGAALIVAIAALLLYMVKKRRET